MFVKKKNLERIAENPIRAAISHLEQSLAQDDFENLLNFVRKYRPFHLLDGSSTASGFCRSMQSTEQLSMAVRTIERALEVLSTDELSTIFSNKSLSSLVMLAKRTDDELESWLRTAANQDDQQDLLEYDTTYLLVPASATETEAAVRLQVRFLENGTVMLRAPGRPWQTFSGEDA